MAGHDEHTNSVEVDKVTIYLGRKVTDGNYGNVDVGCWITVRRGCPDSDIEDAVDTFNRGVALMKPHVAAALKKKAEA